MAFDMPTIRGRSHLVLCSAIKPRRANAIEKTASGEAKRMTQ